MLTQQMTSDIQLLGLYNRITCMTHQFNISITFKQIQYYDYLNCSSKLMKFNLQGNPWSNVHTSSDNQPCMEGVFLERACVAKNWHLMTVVESYCKSKFLSHNNIKLMSHLISQHIIANITIIHYNNIIYEL